MKRENYVPSTSRSVKVRVGRVGNYVPSAPRSVGEGEGGGWYLTENDLVIWVIWGHIELFMRVLRKCNVSPGFARVFVKGHCNSRVFGPVKAIKSGVSFRGQWKSPGPWKT